MPMLVSADPLPRVPLGGRYMGKKRLGRRTWAHCPEPSASAAFVVASSRIMEGLSTSWSWPPLPSSPQVFLPGPQPSRNSAGIPGCGNFVLFAWSPWREKAVIPEHGVPPCRHTWFHQCCIQAWGPSCACSHRWCLSCSDRLLRQGCFVSGAPSIKPGRNSCQKCLPWGSQSPPCWFSSALPLCPQDIRRVKQCGVNTGDLSPNSVCNKRGMWATTQGCSRPRELKLLSRKWGAGGYELWRDLFFPELAQLVGVRLLQKAGEVVPVPPSLG